MVVDRLVAELGYSESSFGNKFKGEFLQVRKDGLDFIALKPQTYMNLSGDCVRDIVNYFKIEPENVIIICDDVNLPFSKLRLRCDGSDGGHNGLKSIFHNLQTNKIARLRVGIDVDPGGKDLADYVLDPRKVVDLPKAVWLGWVESNVAMHLVAAVRPQPRIVKTVVTNPHRNDGSLGV